LGAKPLQKLNEDEAVSDYVTRARYRCGIRHVDWRRGSQRQNFTRSSRLCRKTESRLWRRRRSLPSSSKRWHDEEPYRWVEAIANRREYVEAQLASGSPIAALGYRDGILFLTLARRGRKFSKFIIALHGSDRSSGDIERLRMAAIELASTEGFTRSAADVSLRRLVHYSLSPVMKSAFEQVYGAPYLARMLFAEVGERPEEDLFLRVEYDGEIANSGANFAQARNDSPRSANTTNQGS